MIKPDKVTTIPLGKLGHINPSVLCIVDDVIALMIARSRIMSTVLPLLFLYGWNFATRAKAKTNTSAAAGR